MSNCNEQRTENCKNELSDSQDYVTTGKCKPLDTEQPEYSSVEDFLRRNYGDNEDNTYVENNTENKHTPTANIFQKDVDVPRLKYDCVDVPIDKHIANEEQKKKRYPFENVSRGDIKPASLAMLSNDTEDDKLIDVSGSDYCTGNGDISMNLDEKTATKNVEVGAVNNTTKGSVDVVDFNDNGYEEFSNGSSAEDDDDDDDDSQDYETSIQTDSVFEANDSLVMNDNVVIEDTNIEFPVTQNGTDTKTKRNRRRKQRRAFDFHRKRRRQKSTLTSAAVKKPTYRIRRKRSEILKSVNVYDTPTEGNYMAKRSDGWFRAEIYAKRINKKTDCMEYFVHYVGSDKRLDCWLPRNCIVEEPEPDPEVQIKIEKSGDQENELPERRKTRFGETKMQTAKKNIQVDDKDQERELMTRVRYICKIQIGKYIINTWYHSPYPDEYEFEPKLWICEFCLKYSRYSLFVKVHRGSCGYKSPPGKPVYYKDDLCIYEVDGSYSKMYCQHLCLLAKLFIDHKTVFYDISMFLFYVLCKVDRKGAHIVGYFSKEKDSAENNNVACILVLPPYQYNGYGYMLISFSYELSKLEGVVAGPERPLSDMGLLAYRNYWSRIILQELYQIVKDSDENDELMVLLEDLSEKTSILKKDITETLHWLNLTEHRESNEIVDITPMMICQYFENCKKPKLSIDKAAIMWTPLL